MQQNYILPKRLYHTSNIDETDYSPIVWQRKEKLEKIELLMTDGCSEDVALEALSTHRSSYFRWKKSLLRDSVKLL